MGCDKRGRSLRQQRRGRCHGSEISQGGGRRGKRDSGQQSRAVVCREEGVMAIGLDGVGFTARRGRPG